MAYLPELDQWEEGIYQLETTDPVLGGPDGVDNVQGKQLANRTLNLKNQLALKAPLASPALTGAPTAPTPAGGDNSTKLSTTAFVQAAIIALVNSSPAALDTLNELATALGNDPNFATTITNALALKAPLASPVFTGAPTAPTPAPGDRSTLLATTEFVRAALDGGDYKASVTVATTADLAALSGLLTVDGIVLVAGNRVLVKDQAAGAQNGIYVVAAGAWARAIDADDGSELTSGALVPVERGTANADSLWMLQTDGAITIGTTALTFVQPLGGALATYATKAGVQQAAYSAAAAAGTADAITATFNPAIAALTNGMTLYVRAGAANTTATPTFSPNGLAAKTIVKGNNLALVAADIAGAGHWLGLQYDETLDKWVLTNPITLFSSAAESQGLTLLTKAISPGTLGQALKGANQSLTGTGYQRLPGGLIFQWGVTGALSESSETVTLPITFPNAGLALFATPNRAAAVSGAVSGAYASYVSTSQITVTLDQYNAVSAPVFWFAIGY